MTAVHSNFLNDEQIYEFELPPGASRRPELTAALKTGPGERQITYREHAPGAGPTESDLITHRFDVIGPSGKVSAFQPSDGSPMLIAFWELEQGTLQTFVADQTGCGSDLLRADLTTVIENMTVQMTAAGLPVVKTQGPVSWSSALDEFTAARMFYAPRDGAAWPAVTLTRRPSWAREGSSSQRMTPAIVNASVTNVLQVTVDVAGPSDVSDDLTRYAQDVAETMVPIP